MTSEDRNILNELKQKLLSIYDGKIVLMKVFGSRARGEARQDSNLDILIVIEEENIEEEVIKKICELERDTDFSIFLAPLIMSRAHYDFIRGIPTFFIRNIEREGVEIWNKEREQKLRQT